MRRVLIPTFITLFGFAVSGFAADAVSSCRSAVWRQVHSQYGTRPVDITVNSDNQNYGRQDWVTGTFFLARDNNRDNPYQFTCSVDDRTGDIARLDISPAGAGEANRSTDMRQAAVDSCQGAVNDRLRNRGYGNVSINSIHMDPDGNRVVGSLSAARLWQRCIRLLLPHRPARWRYQVRRSEPPLIITSSFEGRWPKSAPRSHSEFRAQRP